MVHLCKKCNEAIGLHFEDLIGSKPAPKCKPQDLLSYNYGMCADCFYKKYPKARQLPFPLKCGCMLARIEKGAGKYISLCKKHQPYAKDILVRA